MNKKHHKINEVSITFSNNLILPHKNISLDSSRLFHQFK